MKTVAIIGLGYVGLPLALQFGKHFRTIGYDIDLYKINSYIRKVDPANEVTEEDFKAATHLSLTTNLADIVEADFVIIAMPTPVDENNVPDYSYLIKASYGVGSCMKLGATVIYESTVAPGATEDLCIPVLEQASGRKWKSGFWVGYSPERVAPGDKVMPLVKLKKIVSGDTRDTLEDIAELYETIIEAGIYRAPSIRVAEAAKVVENIQRDVNIALMNELATMFHKMDLDTNDVIDAAASKWNFSNYRPGLVGGHCISVDPYYLIQKALEHNHVSHFLNQTRSVNNSMARFIVRETIKDIPDPRGLKVAVFGLTFKENCKDIRNSKVFDLIYEYKSSGMEVFTWDPIADFDTVEHEYGIKMDHFDDIPQCDIVVLAVPHNFLLGDDLKEFMICKTKMGGTFVDVKGKMDRALFEHGPKLWRL